MSNPLLPPAAKTAGRIFVRVAAASLVLAVVAAAWVGVRGYLAVGHIRQAQSLAGSISNNLTETEKVARLVDDFQLETAAARSLTSDPVWRISEHVPYVGAQLGAVGEIAAVVDEVGANALTPLVDVAARFSVDDLQPKNGRFNTKAFSELEGASEGAATSMRAAVARVDAIGTRELLAPLAEQVGVLDAELGRVAGVVDGVHRASVLLPAVLGEKGDRTYLVLFQNNAEWRSLGGMVGAVAELRTSKGSVELTDPFQVHDLDKIDKPVLELPDELLATFNPNPALHAQNATQVPDFAWAGKIWQARWKKETGRTVDGVLALDPVTLSYLLEATGPVTLPNEQKITSENAVDLLLNEVYLKYDVDEQDAFFLATATSAFSRLLGGDTNPKTMLEALSKANDENHLFMWSAKKKEQQALDGTRLQGSLPVSDDANTRVGVYVNDGTGSKLSYYMGVETGVSWCATNRGKGQEALVRLALTNNAPKDIASYPESVVGPGYYGTEVGLTRNVAHIYLPPGADVVRASSSGAGAARAFGIEKHDDHTVVTWGSVLEPEGAATVDVRFRTPRTANLDLVSTPTIPGATKILSPSCN